MLCYLRRSLVKYGKICLAPRQSEGGPAPVNQPRVLVISHNVFSTGNNMGRSLAGLFSGWDPDRLSQLYFCPEEPQLSLCRRYFRVTDGDVLRAFWTRRRPGSPLESGGDAGPAPASLGPLYRLGHTCRSPVPGLLRDALWALSPWFSPALSRWVEEAGLRSFSLPREGPFFPTGLPSVWPGSTACRW